MDIEQKILFIDDKTEEIIKKETSKRQQTKRKNILNRLLSSVDIKEDDIENLGKGENFESILELLLRDQTKGTQVMPIHLINDSGNERHNYITHHHIIWATDNYQQRGSGYFATDEIEACCITRKLNRVIRPRALKSKMEQQRRIKQKAEVFTPSWVCNKQNNLIDEAWFGRKDVFNHENDDHTWTHNPNPIEFPNIKGRTWLDYVTERRIEICCGEAPYIVSRYDTTTGEMIPLQKRIGLLDRKLRIVGEHAKDLAHWREYAYKALRSIYAFEYQGDSLLIARENILVSFIEYYYDFCKRNGITSEITTTSLAHAAYLISWNIFQMDGIKYIIPYSDEYPIEESQSLDFGNTSFTRPKPKDIFAKIAKWTGDGRQKYLIPIEFIKLCK